MSGPEFTPGGTWHMKADPPASETVEAARAALVRLMPYPETHALLDDFEAAIRAAALDEARAAVEELSANDPVMLAGAWRESVLRRIDALMEGK